MPGRKKQVTFQVKYLHLFQLFVSAYPQPTYSWPIEASAFAADLMIARLLSRAPSHPAVRLRKPAYLTAPDIVAVVVGGLGNWRQVGWYVKRGGE